MVQRSGQSGPPPSFWRCARCGTPNPWAGYLTTCIGCGAPRPARPADGTPASASASTSPAAGSAPGFSPGSLFWFGGRWLTGTSWAYFGLVVLVLILIRTLGDRWWFPTVLLFMPRWVFLFPVLVLAAVAGWKRKKAAWVLHALTLGLVTGPLMGLSLPLHRLVEPRPAGEPIRIMTLNQGAAGCDPEKLIRLIETSRVQVICFQEGYTKHEGRPNPTLEAYLDRHFHRNKELSLASRFPIVEELPLLQDADAGGSLWRARLTRARLRTPSGKEFIAASVHMPSMYFAFDRLRRGDVASMRQHIAWRARRFGLVCSALADSPDLPLVVGGDFNTPADSPLMSTVQMAQLRFAFDDAGWGYAYTRPSALPWIGIDHILVGPEWAVRRCWVGLDVGSDHLPLLAEVVLPPSDPAGRASSR